MKKLIVFAFVLLLPLLVGCRTNQSTGGVGFEYIVPRQPIRYARAMRFMLSYYVNGERRISFEPSAIERMTRPYEYEEVYDASITEFIFFHSAEEAYGHPQHVVAAWPNEDFIDGFVIGFNWAINRTGEDRGNGFYIYERTSRRSVITLDSLEARGLSYPITRCDFVDNWEEMNRLWLYFRDREREIIRTAARNGYIPNHIIENYP